MINETPKTKKLARARNWIVEHADVLVPATVVVGFIGLCVAAGVAEAKQINEANEWSKDQMNSGHNVYELSSGALLSVDRTADITVYN